MIEGLSGGQMLLGLFIGLAVLFFLVLKTKVHSFIALIIATVIIGVVGGMPINTTKLADGNTLGIIKSITSGFGGTLGGIGIIIGFGVILGQIFEMSGAAKRMAYTFIKMFGKKREEEAMAITGFFVSIPIFCDSGFVILSPIAKAIARVVNKSVVAIGAALAAGLVITHTMVPPTPGPLGVAGIFDIDVGAFILINLVLAVPMVIGVLFYAKTYLTKHFDLVPNDKGILEKIVGDYNPDAALQQGEDGLPSAFKAFTPLVLPIILILLNTILSALGLKEGLFNVIIFLGQPIIAVGLGLLVAIATLIPTVDKDTAVKEMEKGMASAGIILLVTGAGGALGQIIKDSGLGTYIAQGFAAASIPVVLLPMVIATCVRFIQGSGTVAMITAAGITAPIVIAAGANPMLGAIACCVGSLFASYFNDSFFWVVNRLLGISQVKDQLKVWTAPTTIAWAIGCVEVLVLSMFM
ncbi:MAG: GntP family permease [Succinivibrio dextrinosolvens]|uniref:GntP family permease n=1 Tax=Succinivibrio sp. TaxID=2053619 RepID=UPI0025E30FB4|nr:GntP family permease [Succinivibrio sp.]MBQ9221305.1 GntP family permease [Succinivibrio sp.]MDY6470241.1 GntP family permease [Succinivibrio dextrinosolvens]